MLHKEIGQAYRYGNNTGQRAGEDGVKESFTEYVNGFRIRYAMKLMEEAHPQKRSIEDILYDSGFQSKSTFYTHFKKITGMTPASWIKSNQKVG